MNKLVSTILAGLLVIAAVGCTSGGDSGSSSSAGSQIASAEHTPAFRNLGKRGDSDLPPAAPQKSM